jgi:hypothetical protein
LGIFRAVCSTHAVEPKTDPAILVIGQGLVALAFDLLDLFLGLLFNLRQLLIIELEPFLGGGHGERGDIFRDLGATGIFLLAGHKETRKDSANEKNSGFHAESPYQQNVSTANWRQAA